MSPSPQTTLTVRQAVPADTPKLVGAINDGVYDGMDYFPSDLPSYWTQPHRVTFVCETPEGEVVGIESLKVVDNGMTGITQSLRVLPSWQGKGVGSILSDRLHEYVRSETKIVRMCSTSRATAVAPMRLMQKMGAEIVTKLGISIIHPNLTRGKVSGYDGVVASLQRLTDPAEIREAVLPFLTHPSNDYQNLLVSEWKPYDMADPEVAAHNIRHMTETYGVSFFVDREKDAFLVSMQRVGEHRMPIGNTLRYTVLTKGRAEPVLPIMAAQYNRAVELGCTVCEAVYDGSLFKAGEVAPFLAQLEQETGGKLDTDRLDLTRTGMLLMKNIL